MKYGTKMRYSKKRRTVENELRKIEKELDQNENNLRCFFIPAQQKHEYHHIIPKSEGLQWIAKKENLLPIGTWAHDILHSGTNEEILKLRNIDKYLIKMKKLNENYHLRYLLKLEK